MSSNTFNQPLKTCFILRLSKTHVSARSAAVNINIGAKYLVYKGKSCSIIQGKDFHIFRKMVEIRVKEPIKIADSAYPNRKRTGIIIGNS